MHNPIIAHYIAISSHIPLIDIYTVYIYIFNIIQLSQSTCLYFLFISSLPQYIPTYHIH